MPQKTKIEKSALRKLIHIILLVLLGAFVLLGLAGFATERWLFHTWSALAMDEILFHLSSSIKGTNPEMVHAYILHYGIWVLLAMILFVVSMILTKRNRQLRILFVCFWIALSLGLLEYSLYDLDRRTGLRDYLTQSNSPAQIQTGDFIQDHFTDAGAVDIAFPENEE